MQLPANSNANETYDQHAAKVNKDFAHCKEGLPECIILADSELVEHNAPAAEWRQLLKMLVVGKH